MAKLPIHSQGAIQIFAGTGSVISFFNFATSSFEPKVLDNYASNYQ